MVIAGDLCWTEGSRAVCAAPPNPESYTDLDLLGDD